MKSKPRNQRLYPEGKWAELLAAIGNNDEVAKVFMDAGYDAPPPGSIQGWRSRGSVPTRWTPILLEWAINNDMIKRPLALLRETV
jgi:hypothetical protein